MQTIISFALSALVLILIEPYMGNLLQPIETLIVATKPFSTIVFVIIISLLFVWALPRQKDTPRKS